MISILWSLLKGLATPRTAALLAAVLALGLTVNDCSSQRRKRQEAEAAVARLEAEAALKSFLEGVWGDVEAFLYDAAEKAREADAERRRELQDEIDADTDYGRCAGVPEPRWLCREGYGGSCPDPDG